MMGRGKRFWWEEMKDYDGEMKYYDGEMKDYDGKR